MKHTHPENLKRCALCNAGYKTEARYNVYLVVDGVTKHVMMNHEQHEAFLRKKEEAVRVNFESRSK